jgi:hypothetical protein
MLKPLCSRYSMERRLAMHGKILILVTLLLVFSVSGFAEETFTVSGEVAYSGDSDVYVSLLDFEAFRKYQTEGSPAQLTHAFKSSPERKETGLIPFAFQKVPENSYCIIVFKDINKNQKMDYDVWNQAQEPETSYKETLMPHVTWQEVKFEVNKDVTGIRIPFE